MPVRDRLASLLRNCGYGAQADLARALGEHRNRVNNWVRGTSEIRVDDVPRIARALGVTICELYGVQEGHAAAAGVDLSAAERDALDTIARELVKLRAERPVGREPGRSTVLTLRNILSGWRDLPPDLQNELLAAADEIREARD